MQNGPTLLQQLYHQHRAFLWGIGYRITGTASDADEVVQETFIRALEHPPADTQSPWRPWLVRVAVNLSRDRLRERQRQAYRGTWLPGLVDNSELEAYGSSLPAQSAEARYQIMESATLAFLLALERLSPQQRAVLILRDVLEYTSLELADMLSITPGAVRTCLHRARSSMRDYDRQRQLPTAELHQQTAARLEALLQAIGQRDVKAVEALLVEDVKVLGDGGGLVVSARVPVEGVAAAARFLTRRGIHPDYAGLSLELRSFNGMPMVVLEFSRAPAGYATRSVFGCDLNSQGQICTVYSVLNPAKLHRPGPGPA